MDYDGLYQWRRSSCRATWTPRTSTTNDSIRSCISWAPGKLAEEKSPSFGQHGGWAIDNHSSRAESWVVEEFAYPGFLIHSTTQNSPDISCCNAITRLAIEKLYNRIWKSSISISTKMKLYNTCILTIFLDGSWVLGSYQERCTQDWCSRSMVFVKAIRNQMVPLCAEWWCETDNKATTPFGYCPSTVFLLVRPHFANATRNRCKDLNSFTLGDHQDALVLHGWRLSNNFSLNKAIVVAQNRPLWRLMSTFGATQYSPGAEGGPVLILIDVHGNTGFPGFEEPYGQWYTWVD